MGDTKTVDFSRKMVAVLLFLGLGAFSARAQVTMSLSPATAVPGEQVESRLNVQSDSLIFSGALQITFDPAALRLVGADLDDSTTGLRLDSLDFDAANAGGRLAVQFEDTTASGALTGTSGLELLSLTFAVDSSAAAGGYTLGLDSISVLGSGGEELGTTVTPGLITVTTLVDTGSGGTDEGGEDSIEVEEEDGGGAQQNPLPPKNGLLVQDASGAAGSEVPLPVIASLKTRLSGASFELRFDPQALQVAAVQPGLDAAGFSLGAVDTLGANSSGRLDLALVPDSASGAFLSRGRNTEIAVVTFRLAQGLHGNSEVEPKNVQFVSETGDTLNDVETRSGRINVSDKPSIQRITPDRLVPGGSGVTLDVRGTNLSGVGAAVFGGGEGITVDGLTVESNTSVTLTVSVDASAEPGYRNLKLSGTGGNAELPQAVYVDGAPVLVSLHPDRVHPGDKGVELELRGHSLAEGQSVGVSGDGVTVGLVEVLGPGLMVASLDIDSSAATGIRQVRVTDSLMGESNSLPLEIAARLHDSEGDSLEHGDSTHTEPGDSLAYEHGDSLEPRDTSHTEPRDSLSYQHGDSLEPHDSTLGRPDSSGGGSDSTAEAGDLDHDGKVNVSDLLLLLRALTSSQSDYNPALDLDGNGEVNIMDLIAIIGAMNGKKNGIIKHSDSGSHLASAGGQNYGFSVDGEAATVTFPDGSVLKVKAGAGGGISADFGAALAFLEGTPNGAALLPKTFAMGQNSPNPFNPSTTIQYQVPADEPVAVRLTVYNLRGQAVRSLVEAVQGPGVYSVQWDGRDSQGRPLSSGIYFYRMSAGSFSQTRKMVLVK